MTYRKLYEKAERKLEKGEITSGEFDEMTKPLDEEIRPHGEWLTEPHSRIIHCSKCGAQENMLKIHIAKWCYSCGADMRKEGDKSD